MSKFSSFKEYWKYWWQIWFRGRFILGYFYFYQLGSHQEGSSTEYFFGQYNFDGDGTTPYTLNFYYNSLLDQGKDFYATQIMYVPPTESEFTSGF